MRFLCFASTLELLLLLASCARSDVAAARAQLGDAAGTASDRVPAAPQVAVSSRAVDCCTEQTRREVFGLRASSRGQLEQREQVRSRDVPRRRVHSAPVHAVRVRFGTDPSVYVLIDDDGDRRVDRARLEKRAAAPQPALAAEVRPEPLLMPEPAPGEAHGWRYVRYGTEQWLRVPLGTLFELSDYSS